MQQLPALKSAILIAVGILLGNYFSLSWLILSIFIIGTILLIYLTRQMDQSLLILCLILIGFGQYHQTQHHPQYHIIHHLDNNTPVTIYGILAKDPLIKEDKSELIINIHHILKNDILYHSIGKARFVSYNQNYNCLKYGDAIKARGILFLPLGKRNPGGFNYQAYLERKNIHALFKTSKTDSLIFLGQNQGSLFLNELIYPCRRWIKKIVFQTLSHQNATFLNALLLGDKSTLSDNITQNFIQLGISHVLAVSGLHVGFVLLIFSTLFRIIRLPKQYWTILTIFILLFYLCLNEMKPSIFRATLMAVFYLIGRLLQRRIFPLNILGFSALVTLLIHPLDLFDSGFQLSYGAVISILLLFKPIKNSIIKLIKLETFQKTFILNLIISGIAISLSIQIGTLPITLYHFNQVAPINILLNLLVIPLTGLTVIFGFIIIILGTINHWLAQIYGSLNDILISILIKGTRLFSELSDIALYHAPLTILEIFIYYLVIILLLNWTKTTIRKKLLIIILIVGNGWIWQKTITDSSNSLTWAQLDVGQGDAAVIHLPRNKTLLIDGGDCTKYWDNGERVIAPYLKHNHIHHLDAVILTHPHQDHMGGLFYILNNFSIGQIITPKLNEQKRYNIKLKRTIQKNEIPHKIISMPDSIIKFPGVKLYFLWPDTSYPDYQNIIMDNINNHSIVTHLLYGKNQILFTGDMEKEAEQAIINSGQNLKSTAIKVGHHGSKTASSKPFIKRVNTEWAVISVGSNNRFNLPDSVITQQFKKSGIKLRRTDIQGAIVFKSKNGELFKEIQWQKR